MQKTKKRMVSWIMLVIMIGLSMTGCKKGDNEKGKEAKGRYQEEEIALPEESQMILDLKRLEDESVRLITEKGIFESKDNGTKWDKLEIASSYFSTPETAPQNGATDANGNTILTVPDSDPKLKPKYVYIDKDGTERVLDITLPAFEGMGGTSQEDNNETIENRLFSSGFASNGDVLGLDISGILYQINKETGEIIRSYDTNSYSSFFSMDDTLFLSTYEGEIELYKLSNGDIMDKNKTLDKYFTDAKSKGGDQFTTGGAASLLRASNVADELLICDGTGLYKYNLKGSVIEQLIKGSLTSLGDPDTNFTGLVQTKDNSFLIGTGTIKGGQKLFKYTYSKTADTSPSKELTAYALEDSKALQQAVALFQKKNPDIHIKIEIGTAEGVSRADAIRTLNTNIMAGKGPDILILDGMPIEKYIQKGLLADISDIVDEVAKSDGLYEKIAKTYEKDGKTYAIPSHFEIPMLSGSEDTINTVKNLTTLADQVEKLRSENPTASTIMGSESSRQLLERLYNLTAESLSKDDGTLDEQAVLQLLENAKKIYTADMQNKTAEEKDKMKAEAEAAETSITGLSGMAGLPGALKLEIGSLFTIDHLASVSSLEKKSNSTHTLFSNSEKTTYIPSASLGINAKSKQIENAKKFVKDFISEGTQSADNTGENGFPINKKAFDKLSVNANENAEGGAGMMILEGENGEMINVQIDWPTQEEIDALKKQIDTLEVPNIIDYTIADLIIEEGSKSIEGEISEAEATTNILKKANLYLSE